MIEYLKSFDNWAKPLKSSFFVRTSLTTGQLRDGIRKHLDSNDSGVVEAITAADWATSNIAKEVTDWMRNSL